jgi:CheY-like chemotaxis protein
VARYLAGGADAVVGKPIEVRQLLETIAGLMAAKPAPAPRRRKRKAA